MIRTLQHYLPRPDIEFHRARSRKLDFVSPDKRHEKSRFVEPASGNAMSDAGPCNTTSSKKWCSRRAVSSSPLKETPLRGPSSRFWFPPLETPNVLSRRARSRKRDCDGGSCNTTPNSKIEHLQFIFSILFKSGQTAEVIRAL